MIWKIINTAIYLFEMFINVMLVTQCWLIPAAVVGDLDIKLVFSN